MEASSCLITPSIKGLDHFSSRSRSRSTILKRRFTSFSTTRLPSRSSINVSCCGLPNSQGELPAASADWRTFRARLVASETASPPTAVVAGGDKWAHPLPFPEKGCLLLATRKLDGVHIFERTIILILAVSPTRLLGVILNRPSLMSIASTLAATFEGRPLLFGGPVKEEGLFLYKGRKGAGVFEEVMEGLYYGTREAVGCAAEMVRRGAVAEEELVFFDGCCGWEKTQLEDEVKAGYWSIVACSSAVVAAVATATEGKEGDGKGVWEEVVGLAGGR